MQPELSFLRRIFIVLMPGAHLNRSLRILITTNSILVFIAGLFSPFYAVFVKNLGGSIAFAGLSWAIFPIVAGVLILFFSRFELRVKEQELLIALGYLIRAGVFLSYALMTSIPQLIMTQILWGIATAIGTPAFDSVYASHTTTESSILQWGDYEGVTAIVSGLAALLGGLIIQYIGYTPIFALMAIISLVLGIYIIRLPREVL